MITAIPQNEINPNLEFDHPVKLTAIMYLKEALMKERYEDCPVIIRIAREFGTGDHEIKGILASTARMLSGRKWQIPKVDLKERRKIRRLK